MKEPREIERTASYLVLSRRRGQSLYQDLLATRTQVARYQRLATSLAERLDERENQLARCLHELALLRGEEPQSFMRHWLAEAAKGGEAWATR